jgi:hypothetical protein
MGLILESSPLHPSTLIIFCSISPSLPVAIFSFVLFCVGPFKAICTFIDSAFLIDSGHAKVSLLGLLYLAGK